MVAVMAQAFLATTQDHYACSPPTILVTLDLLHVAMKKEAFLELSGKERREEERRGEERRGEEGRGEKRRGEER